MNAKAPETSTPAKATRLTNGSGVAAVLAAGIGAFTLAVLAVATDHIVALQRLMVFYKPTGPLSGVTTASILIWLPVWVGLDLRWQRRTVTGSRIYIISLTLLGLSLMLTFPPFGDLF